MTRLERRVVLAGRERGVMRPLVARGGVAVMTVVLQGSSEAVQPNWYLQIAHEGIA